MNKPQAARRFFTKAKPLKALLPLAFFLILLASLPFFTAAFSGCNQRTPIIYSLDPRIGMLGEPLTILGSNFGDERGDSLVTVAGIQPVGSAYLEWSDRKIVLQLPDFGESGLVYVHVNGRRSNGLLFANRSGLPRQTQESDAGVRPRITGVSPPSAPVGSLVTITGTGFGSSRDRSGVFFSWNPDITLSAPAELWTPEFTKVSEADFGYEFWSEREIRVRVPDGASDGTIEVRTPRGVSAPHLFSIRDRPGTKTFRDRRVYTLTASVNIIPIEAEDSNSLFLWVPRPASSAWQRNVEILFSNPRPFVENHQGTSIFRKEDMVPGRESRVNISWKVDVYRVETAVRPQAIRTDTNSSIHRIFTQSEPLIPSDDPRIRAAAARILGGERNPYLAARRIYQWMISEGIVREGRIENDIFTALETGEADAFTATLLYCALLRSVGIPALPVAGVLINSQNITANHYWAEFWVDGFGWIPVDVAMGSGAVPVPFRALPEHNAVSAADFYFGNIDSQRIAFSRGIANLSPMTPSGRTVALSRSYSLHNLWEEAVGIDSYTSLWGDIIITGIYAQ